jgi:hypothetical protein
MTPPAPEIKSEDVRYGYSYDQSYNNTWHYTNEYNLVPQPSHYYNTSSCVDAANIIRTMRSDVGSDLDSDLGCRVPDQAYYVNNNVAFGMMDKYSIPHTAV